MDFSLTQEMLAYVQSCEAEAVVLLEALCAIPAPSGHEEKRAQFCKRWLENAGCEGVYIDGALNVIWPVCCDGRNDLIAFLAHTDTVFPDTEPMPLVNDGEYLHCPGVGDDTACLVNLLLAARYIAQSGIRPRRGVLFVANSCEEGLGNLKGTRQLMESYAGRIRNFYSFDSRYDAYANRCVGSHRYKLTFRTEGGHSYGAFGSRNAIHALSQVVCRLYQCRVPVNGDSKTTYNVGLAEGGTSVNTIAQEAVLYYEYRSDDAACLTQMEAFFHRTIEEARAEGIADITVETVGIRPCGIPVDEAEFSQMCRRIEAICEEYAGVKCIGKPGSTDCNIPMSMGIPALAVGSFLGCGAHTREEKVLIASLPVGLKITLALILSYFR